MIEGVFTSQTLAGFVQDSEAFGPCVDAYFGLLDLNRDGFLSPSELRGGLNQIFAVESEVQPLEEIEAVYAAIIEKFGENIDRKGFQSLIEEIVFAMARAFGSSPVVMVLHREGFIMKAIQHEIDQNGSRNGK